MHPTSTLRAVAMFKGKSAAFLQDATTAITPFQCFFLFFCVLVFYCDFFLINQIFIGILPSESRM
jgi:hypothetical protein